MSNNNIKDLSPKPSPEPSQTIKSDLSKSPLIPNAKTILILSTGGTFNCVKTKNGLIPEFHEKELKLKLKTVDNNVNIKIEEVFNLDSANVQPKHWGMLATKIEENYKKYDGIVIIHGTDTLAYTSSMLSHMCNGIPIPIVISGSQLSINDPINDAYENIRTAIYMAKSEKPGVFVAFNRKIMLGSCVSKTHSMSFDAFESINIDNVAELNVYGMSFKNELIKDPDPFFKVRKNYCEDVFLLKLIPGLKPDILDFLVKQNYKGIVIESYGLGGLPNTKDNNFFLKCKEIIQKGIKVIILSQCTYDGIDLNVYETGIKLKNIGIAYMPKATKEYAVTRLMWELGNNK